MVDEAVQVTENAGVAGTVVQATGGEPASQSQSGSSEQASQSLGLIEPPTPAVQAAPGALNPPTAKVSQVTSPENAATLIKAKGSELHTLLHNIAHYSTLPFEEVEQVIADIKHLMAFIRSKV